MLHLIAAHHGFGRPHFPPDLAFDLEPRGKDVESIAAEIPQAIRPASAQVWALGAGLSGVAPSRCRLRRQR